MKFKTKVHHANDWVAIHITKVFGTMWAFYVALIYGLSPILFPSCIEKILYWSNFIQLIALPVLAVGTNILGKSSERRAKQTHDAVMEELKILKGLMSEKQRER